MAVARESASQKTIEEYAFRLCRDYWEDFKQLESHFVKTQTYFTQTDQLVFNALPVQRMNSFDGVLVQVINLKPLIDLYVTPLRSGKFGAGFLLSGNGTIVYDHETEVVGMNIFDGMHDQYPSLLAVDHDLVSKESGKAEYSFTVKRSGKVSRKLISWNTAWIGDSKLVVCLSAPDIEIDASIAETRIFQLISQGLLLAMIVLVLYSLIRRDADRKIRHNERRLVLALEGNRDGVWEWNIKTSEVYFSSRWKEMLGFKDNEISNILDEWDSRVHPDDIDKVYDDINRHIAGETPFYENEHRVLCKDGHYKWILDRGKVYSSDDDGKPEWMIGTHTDITYKKKVELENRQLSMAVQESPSAVVITDPAGTIEYVNRSFEEITGYSFDEAYGKNPSEIIKAEFGQDELYKDLWKTISAGELWRGELINRTKSGDNYWCRLSISPVFNDTGTIINYIGIQEDLTDLKHKEEELNRLATTDELTGINNRRYFMELARKEMPRVKRHGSSAVLTILDIDHFKLVNDTYGHGFGDFVLNELASLVGKTIRDIDIFGRIGGEEFALVLPQTDKAGAEILLERLRLAIEEHEFKHQGTAVKITASFGYTLFMKDSSESFDELMKQADRALYLAKEQGRNRFVFSGQQNKRPF